MAGNTAGSTPPDKLTPQQPTLPKVNRIEASDITASLKAGVADFLARPVMSGFFGLFYAGFGLFAQESVEDRVYSIWGRRLWLLWLLCQKFMKMAVSLFLVGS